MKKIFLFLLLFLIYLPGVQASVEKTIVINEIRWMGSSKSTSDEWLELRNLTDFDVDISGWEISGAATKGKDLTIPAGSLISANGYFLIANYPKNSDKTILDIEADWFTPSVSLVNSERQYLLKNDLGETVDIINTEFDDPLAGDKENKWSQERILNPTDGTKSNNWYTATESKNLKDSASEFATPRFLNSEPLYLPGSLILEAKSNERGVLVTGYLTAIPGLLFNKKIYIQDNTAGIRVYLIREDWPSLNLGDKVRLRGKIHFYHGEKEIRVIDLSDFELLSKGKHSFFEMKTGEIEKFEGSYVKISGIITETSSDIFYVNDGTGGVKISVKDSTGINTPSKRKGDTAKILGVVNNWNGNFRILPVQQSDIKIILQSKEKVRYNLSIKEVRAKPKGTLVKTCGVVSVEPGRLGKTIFYIQDNVAGIQIYSWYKDFPALKVGDYIEVSGETSNNRGEKRIKIKQAGDIKILGKRAPPKSIKIKIFQAQNYEGMLVTVRGKIVKTSGKTFYIHDGTGVIKIYIKKETNIKKPRTYKGDIVEITGIVSRTQAGLRVLPRYQKDFNLVWTKPKKAKKVARASTWKKLDLKESQAMINAQIITENSLAKNIGLLLLFLSGSSLIVLGTLKYKKIL